MKKLLFAAMVLLGACGTWGLDLLHEYFGDSTVQCWNITGEGAPATCNNTWIESPDNITTMSIVAAPSVYDSALLWSNPAPYQHLYYDFGENKTYPLTVRMALYFDTITMESGGYQTIFVANGTAGGTATAYIGIIDVSGNPTLVGASLGYSSMSTATAISQGTWYYITLYLASTRSESNIKVGTTAWTGTPYTFTRGDYPCGRLSIGIWQQYLTKTNITYHCGFLDVQDSISASKPPVITNASIAIDTVGKSLSRSHTNTGGAATSWTCYALPRGYAFNTSTGYITGIPDTIKAQSIYAIIATNADGDDTCYDTISSVVGVPIHSGNTWLCRSVNEDNIQVGIDSAADGDTVIMPAGSSKWYGRAGSGSAKVPVVINNKQITLRGSGVDSTFITNGTVGTSYDNYMLLIAAGIKPFRISNFSILDTPSTAGCSIIKMNKSYSITTACEGWRIDHINFKLCGDVFIGSSPVGISGLFYGVFDACTSKTFNASGSANFIAGSFYQDETNVPPNYMGKKTWDISAEFGTSKQVFIENCYFDYSIAGYPANIIDGNSGFKYTIRNCIINGTSVEIHSPCTAGWRGGKGWEIYNNTFSNSVGFALKMRSGTGVIFNNTISDSCTSPMIFDNQRMDSATAMACLNGLNCWCNGGCDLDGNDSLQGYPCLDQIGVGYGDIGVQTLIPAYIWGNTYIGNSYDTIILNPALDTVSLKLHIAKNRNYFQSIVKPFYYAYTYPHPLTGDAPSMSVSSVSPASGGAGIPDTINGSGFQATQGNGYVKYGTTSATIVSWSDTKIATMVPSLAAATYKVFVVNNDMQVDSLETFEVMGGASYTLTVTDDGHGSTTGGGVQDSGVAGGNIVATADMGYSFVNWTVTAGMASITNASSATTTVTLSSNATVRANFVGTGGAITFTDIPDSTVYQYPHVGHSPGKFPVITGTYTGYPTEISAKVLDYNTGAIVLDSTVINAAPTGGTFSDTLKGIPCGGPYRLVVRTNLLNDTMRGTHKWGVGEVIGVWGQSNITPLEVGGTLNTVNGFSVQFLNDVPHKLHDSWMTTASPAGWTSILPACSNKILADINNRFPIGFCGKAVGGTSILYKLPGVWYWTDRNAANPTDMTTLYGQFLTYTKNQKPNVVLGYQGESNATDTYAAYTTAMNKLFSDISTDFGYTPLFCLVQIRGGYFDSANATTGWWNIARAHMDIANDSTILLAACTYDLPTYDGVHLSPVAQNKCGTRLGKTIARIYNDSIQYGYRLRIDSARAISRGNIKIYLRKTLGKTLLDVAKSRFSYSTSILSTIPASSATKISDTTININVYDRFFNYTSYLEYDKIRPQNQPSLGVIYNSDSIPLEPDRGTSILVNVNQPDLAMTSDRYFISGDPATTSAWSLTSGGATGASVPADSTLVILDAGGNNVFTLGANVNYKSMLITSDHTANITMTGRTVHLKYCLSNSGTGTFAWPTNMNLDSNGFSLQIASTAGTQTVTNCNLYPGTANTYGLVQIEAGSYTYPNFFKSATFQQGSVCGIYGIKGVQLLSLTSAPPLVMNNNCSLSVYSTGLNLLNDYGKFFTLGTGVYLGGTGTWQFQNYTGPDTINGLSSDAKYTLIRVNRWGGTGINNIYFNGDQYLPNTATYRIVFSTSASINKVFMRGYALTVPGLQVGTLHATDTVEMHFGIGTHYLETFDCDAYKTGKNIIYLDSGIIYCSKNLKFHSSNLIYPGINTISFTDTAPSTYTTAGLSVNNIICNKSANGLTITGPLRCDSLVLTDGTFAQAAATDTVYSADAVDNTSDAVTNTAPWNISNRLQVASGLTLTLAKLIIGGTSGHPDTLTGTAAWNLALSGTQRDSLSYLYVKNCQLSAGDSLILTDGTSVDGGGNSGNVKFPAGSGSTDRRHRGWFGLGLWLRP